MVEFRSGYRRNPMKHDRIRSYFIGIPVGSASRNPIARNPTTSQLDPIEIFLRQTGSDRAGSTWEESTFHYF